MPFDVRKDLAAISNLAQTPFNLAAPSTSKANSLTEVIAQAKAAPGSLSIGHGGNGTSMYFNRAVVHHHGGRADRPRPLSRHRAGGERSDRRPYWARHRRSPAVRRPPSVTAGSRGSRSREAALRLFPPDIPTFDDRG